MRFTKHSGSSTGDPRKKLLRRGAAVLAAAAIAGTGVAGLGATASADPAVETINPFAINKPSTPSQ